MEPPPITQETVSYQMARDVFIRVIFRRMFFRWRRLRSMALFLAAAILFYFAGVELRYLSLALVAFLIFLPIALYRGVARATDQNAQFTDPKTVTYGPAGVIVVGPNYRSELAWSMFKGFSEDGDYFYLHLTDSGWDSFAPKSAFTAEQQESFRRCAGTLAKKR